MSQQTACIHLQAHLPVGCIAGRHREVLPLCVGGNNPLALRLHQQQQPYNRCTATNGHNFTANAKHALSSMDTCNAKHRVPTLPHHIPLTQRL